MKNWYNSLAPRERTLVSYGSIVALLVLSWLLIAKPLSDNHTKLNKRIQQQHEDLKTIQAQSIQVKQLLQQDSNTVSISSKNPQQLIERSLQTWRLKPSLERMQTQGSKGVRLTLKKANVDRAMRFLYELENKHGLSISNMTINSSNKELGFADIRLTIKREKN